MADGKVIVEYGGDTGGIDDANAEAESKVSSCGAKLANIAKTAAVAIGAAFVAAGTAAVKFGTEYEESVATIVKATGASGDALKGLEDDFAAIYSNVPDDMASVASALGEVNTRLGYTGEELQSTTKLFLDFSRATGVDATAAVGDITRLINQWGIDASEIPAILDKLTVAGQVSGVSIETLTSNIQSNAGTLMQLGYSLDESIAMLAAFEKEGVNAENVLMGMKQSFAKSAAAGTDAKEDFAALIETIKNCEDATEANSLAIEIFGARAAPEMIRAIQAGQLSFEEYIDVVNEAGGTLESTTQTSLTTAQKFTQITNQVKLALAGVFEEAVPIIEELLPVLSNLLNKLVPIASSLILKLLPVLQNLLNKVLDPLLKLIDKILPPLVNLFAGVIDVLAELIDQALPIIIDLFEELEPTFSVFTDTLLPLIITLFKQLIKPLLELAGNVLPALAQLFNRLAPIIAELASNAIGTLIKAAEQLMPLFLNIIQSILPPLINLFDALMPLILSVADVVASALCDALISLVPLIAQFIEQLLPLFINLLNEIIPVVLEIAQKVLPILVDIINAILPLVMQIIETVLPFVINLLSALLPVISQLIDSILPILVEILDALMPILNLLISLLQPILDLFLSLLQPILDLVLTALTPLLEILAPIIKVIGELIENALKPLLDNFKNVFAGVADVVTNIVSTIKTHFEQVIDFIKNVFSGNWSAAWDNVKNIFSNMWDGIKNIGKSALNSVISMFESGLNGIINFINSITSGLSKVWTWAGIPAIPAIPTVNIPRLKTGIDFVPSDMYPSYLDYGERVLTQEENLKFNAMGGLAGMERALSDSASHETGGGGIIRIENVMYGDVEMDGFKVATIVLRNLDEANKFI